MLQFCGLPGWPGFIALAMGLLLLFVVLVRSIRDHRAILVLSVANVYNQRRPAPQKPADITVRSPWPFRVGLILCLLAALYLGGLYFFPCGLYR